MHFPKFLSAETVLVLHELAQILLLICSFSERLSAPHPQMMIVLLPALA